MLDTSRWSWAERMGETGVNGLSQEDRATLAELRENMDITRAMLVEAKDDFDRACDAVYAFVRAKRGESA